MGSGADVEGGVMVWNVDYGVRRVVGSWQVYKIISSFHKGIDQLTGPSLRAGFFKVLSIDINELYWLLLRKRCPVVDSGYHSTAFSPQKALKWVRR